MFIGTQAENFAMWLQDMVNNDGLLWKIGFGLLCCLSLVSLLRSWRNIKKKDWESYYFILLCAACLWWAGGTLLSMFLADQSTASFVASLSAPGVLFIPALLCLHIQKQVSYKDITWYIILLTLAVPVFLTFAYVQPLLFEEAVLSIPLGDTDWRGIVYFVYAAIVLMRSYLLCFNVFYQMPRHMRRSTYYLLASITAVFIYNIVLLLVGGLAASVATPLGIAAMLYCLFDAFSVASSANVIVTSRDFVFGSLSTSILVLSRKMRVLDWNKRPPHSMAPLPEPVYRESFANYRKRMIDEGNGRVSPHGDNIITTLTDGTEHHYLITTQEVRGKKRHFGYIAEISEVTKIYDVLRYVEEIAILDQLTGLYNRNAYLGMVRQFIVPANMPLAVVVGDVNNLKQINDSFGHLCGDAMLTAVSEAMQRHMPPGSFTARIGGDEFVLLIPGGSQTDAGTFIDAVSAELQHLPDEGYGVPTVSWGSALMLSAEEEYNEVFARADQIMYRSKREHSHFRSSGFVPPLDPGNNIPGTDHYDDTPPQPPQAPPNTGELPPQAPLDAMDTPPHAEAAESLYTEAAAPLHESAPSPAEVPPEAGILNTEEAPQFDAPQGDAATSSPAFQQIGQFNPFALPDSNDESMAGDEEPRP